MRGKGRFRYMEGGWVEERATSRWRGISGPEFRRAVRGVRAEHVSRLHIGKLQLHLKICAVVNPESATPERTGG